MFKRIFWAVFFLVLCRGGSAWSAPSLAEVYSFGYQLQNANVSRLMTAPHNLLIIDYSKDGSQGGAFTAAEIAAIRNSGKKVLAYLSIGEAEDYRYYFKSSWIRSKRGAPCGKVRTRKAPAWLDDSNKAWCGNYKVKYWMRSWQRIMYGVKGGKRKSYVDRIVDAGFDGIYLDIVDGYEYWLEKPSTSRRRTAAADMAALVVKLGRYARKNRGKADFVVVPQNGAGIIKRITPRLKAKYLAGIQGIGAEDSFYFGPADEDNPYAPQPVLRVLAQYVKAGKRVLAVDYLLDEAKQLDFGRRACAQGFLPQVANRALDTLDTQVLIGCQCLFTVNGYVC